MQKLDDVPADRAAAAAAVVAACLWPSGLYFTDGPGGALNLWPVLRQCGCGIAHIANDEEHLTFMFVVFCGLVGKP